MFDTLTLYVNVLNTLIIASYSFQLSHLSNALCQFFWYSWYGISNFNTGNALSHTSTYEGIIIYSYYINKAANLPTNVEIKINGLNSHFFSLENCSIQIEIETSMIMHLLR